MLNRYCSKIPIELVICATQRNRNKKNGTRKWQVMVTDNGIPQLSSTTRIVITVEDINDHSPEFDQKFYKVQIPVNAKLDQALFQVKHFVFSYLY